MARRQEQEDARPQVTEVAPNVARLELPISMPGLGHVNCYAILDRDGVALMDPGLPGTPTRKAIVERLGQLDLEVRHVHTVIVTHSHPDHFGGASWLADEAGARVIGHRDFSFGMSAPEQPEVSVEDLEAQRTGKPPAEEPQKPADGGRGHAYSMSWGGKTPWGGSRPRPPMRSRLRWTFMRRFGSSSFMPTITHPVDHGDVLELGGREWFVLHTPGHTQDHFCLHDPQEGLFLAGDHVLPTITPHISGITAATDPLKSFFYSLDRVGEITGVKNVLPAHGHPFTDLRRRTEEIKRHHYERLDRVRDISREYGRPATVQEFTERLFKKRSWGPMAESETYAHLEHLRHEGNAERHTRPDGVMLYETG